MFVRKPFLTLLIAFALVTCAAGIYKWIDQKGVTHYSDQPPVGRTSQQMQASPEPARPVPATVPAAAPSESLAQREQEFQKRQLADEQRAFEERRAERERARSALKTGDAQRNLTLSPYLMTMRKWINYEMHFDRLAGTVGLIVKARPENREPVWLWVVFELPITPSDYTNIDNPDPPVMIVPLSPMVRVTPNEEVKLEAPTVEHFRCRSYFVSLIVYADSGKREQLGEHSEFIQSRLNGLKIRSDTDLANALRTPGECVPPHQP